MCGGGSDDGGGSNDNTSSSGGGTGVGRSDYDGGGSKFGGSFNDDATGKNDSVSSSGMNDYGDGDNYGGYEDDVGSFADNWSSAGGSISNDVNVTDEGNYYDAFGDFPSFDTPSSNTSNFGTLDPGETTDAGFTDFGFGYDNYSVDQGYNTPDVEAPPTPVQSYNYTTNSWDYSVDGKKVDKATYDNAVEARSSYVDNLGVQGWNEAGLSKQEFAEQYAQNTVGLSNKNVQGGNWTSSAWNDALNQANNLYDYMNEYESQERAFMENYNEAVARGEIIPDTTVNYLGTNPTQQSIDQVYNQLGKGFQVANARFNNPLGNYLGSKIPEGQEQRYNQAIDAYNKGAGMFGTNYVVDNYGNIGYQTLAQRAGDFLGNTLLASKIGMEGLNYTPYGEAYNTVMDRSQATFKPFGLLGDMLGSKVGAAAGEYVGQQMYNATGNVNQAIAAGMGAGLLGQQGTAYATSALGDLTGMNSIPLGSNPATLSKNEEAMMALDEDNEASGIGSRVDGGDGEGAQVSDFGAAMGQGDGLGSSSPSQGVNMNNTAVQSYDASDFGAGQNETVGTATETEFDADAYLLEQAQGANPNTQQITDLYGGMPYTSDVNPLFSAQVPGVQYLSQGRQRQYGTATYNVVDPLTNYLRGRRRGFGDKLTGIVV